MRRAIVLLAALVAIYLAAGVWTTRRISATGDEVGYLMAADALVRGEGFELTGRWREIATASYSPGDPIPPDEFDRTTAPSLRDGGSYPIHDLTFSIVVAPLLAAGGRAWVVAAMAPLVALAVALGYRAARARAAPAALWGAAVTALSAPAITYSGQVFADSVAPVAVGVVVCGLAGALPLRAAAVAVAVLPLLHVRYWPLVAGLALALVALRRPRPGELALLALPTAVAVGLYSLLDLAVYGLALPHAGFLLFFREGDGGIETYAGAAGIAGLFVDRAFGLIPAAPIAALLFAGAGRMLGRPGERALALAPLAYLLLVPFVDWTGGFSPQARYFAPLIPFMPLLYARAFEWRPARVAAAPLAAWTLAQSAVFVVAPWLRYDAFAVPPLADRAWSAVLRVTPSAAFPLFGAEGATVPLTVLWVCALLVIAGLAMRSSRSPRAGAA